MHYYYFKCRFRLNHFARFCLVAAAGLLMIASGQAGKRALGGQGLPGFLAGLAWLARFLFIILYRLTISKTKNKQISRLSSTKNT